jgi:uncharacterized protein
MARCKVSDTTIAEALLETILGPEEEVTVKPELEAQLASWRRKAWPFSACYQNWRALGLPAPEPVPVSAAATAAKGRPGRNDACPCGSGKKYKKCCGAELNRG